MSRVGNIVAPGGAARAGLAGLVIALALAGAGRAQEVPADPAAFTEAVAQLYRSGPQGVETHVDGPLELTVRSAGREEKVYLTTAFSACLRDRPSCAAFVFRQVQAMKGGSSRMRCFHARISASQSARRPMSTTWSRSQSRRDRHRSPSLWSTISG